MKTSILTALLLVSSLISVKAADGTTITQIGKLSFAVAASPKTSSVLILDSNGNLVHQEYLATNKLFKLDSLSDGKYTIKVLDTRKNSIAVKTFEIKSETKKDLIVLN